MRDNLIREREGGRLPLEVRSLGFSGRYSDPNDKVDT